mgnify:CR=1 FL=1
MSKWNSEIENCERNTRTSIIATVIGTAEVLVYEDIVEARQKHDVKVAAARGRQTSKRSTSAPSQVTRKISRSNEKDEAIIEIRASGIEKYCSVLKFSKFKDLSLKSQGDNKCVCVWPNVRGAAIS